MKTTILIFVTAFLISCNSKPETAKSDAVAVNAAEPDMFMAPAPVGAAQQSTQEVQMGAASSWKDESLSKRQAMGGRSNNVYLSSKGALASVNMTLTDVSNEDNSEEAKQEEEQKESRIIKTANLDFQVASLTEADSLIKSISNGDKIYLSWQESANLSDRVVNKGTLRVPAEHFEQVIEQLMKLSVFTQTKNISAEDVTEEYVDIITRLKTKREVEQRYLEILRKAKTIEEILSVEAHLSSIREEIESKEGRLKFLSDRVAYSTIHYTYYEKIQLAKAPETGFWFRTKNAFGNGWSGLQHFVVGIFSIWPFLLLMAIIGWLAYRYRHRFRLSDDRNT